MYKLVLASILLAAAFSLPEQSSPLKQIRILNQESDITPEGNYHWAYETENGISAQEQGGPKAIGNDVGTAAQGGFHYTSPEGIPFTLTYVADENGFQPQGEHLPTPPPIPQQILRALQYLESHPEPTTQ